jgi:predicted transcriptional regulator
MNSLFGIELLSLYEQPSIERLWKRVKGKLRTKHYNIFADFRNVIDSIITNTDKEDTEAIKKLI